ncbi:MAG TPA: hypothetical protein VGV62_00850 [Xanthobacteraceae bacterium]|nr:hypothetical protein [Xanthobacteraceae bacterium]
MASRLGSTRHDKILIATGAGKAAWSVVGESARRSAINSIAPAAAARQRAQRWLQSGRIIQSAFTNKWELRATSLGFSKQVLVFGKQVLVFENQVLVFECKQDSQT